MNPYLRSWKGFKREELPLWGHGVKPREGRRTCMYAAESRLRV